MLVVTALERSVLGGCEGGTEGVWEKGLMVVMGELGEGEKGCGGRDGVVSRDSSAGYGHELVMGELGERSRSLCIPGL